MGHVFPGFDALERLCEEAGYSAQAREAVARTLSLPTPALAEALVLRNQGTLVLSDDGDTRLDVLRAAVKSRGLSARDGDVGVFHVRDGSDGVADQSVDFALALGTQLDAAGLPKGARQLLQGALTELATNIQQHAGESPRGYILYELSDRRLSLSVLDGGQGVVAGYTRVAPELEGLSAADALVMAVRDHRSRLAPLETGRGTGFGTVLRAMKTLDAQLRVRSGNATLETDSGAGAEWVVGEQAELRGFVVTLLLAW